MGLLLLDGTLVGLCFDLIQQNVTRPTKLRGRAEIIQPSGLIFDFLEQLDVVTPRDRRGKVSSGRFLNRLFKNWAALGLGKCGPG